MSTNPQEDRIPPVRGLVCAGNADGQSFPLTSLKQWIHLHRAGFKSDKVDVLVESQPRGAVVELLEFAASEGMTYSVRMADTPLDDDLQAYADAGIMDVFFAPEVFRPQVFEGICSTCAELGLPLRVQITRPLFDSSALEEVASMLWADPVRSINLAPHDPFLPQRTCSATEVRRLLDQTGELAHAAADHGKEVNILRLPFCLMPRERWPEVLTNNQMFLHHQQYIFESYDLAKALFHCSPSRMASGLEHQLSADATLYHVVNKAAFPRILQNPRLHTWLWLKHKITRKWDQLRRKNQPLPERVDAYEAALEKVRAESDRHLQPACRDCGLKRICDHGLPPLRSVLPSVAYTTQPQEDAVSVLHFNREQTKYFDQVDAPRREQLEDLGDIAAEARHIVDETPPTKVFKYDEYHIEGHWTDRLVGAVRWWSLTTDGLRSTELARVEPPFTVGCTFGGGMADHVGFSFGDYIYLMAPMIAPTHHIAVHVRRDGSYVLLRDGEPVRPTEFMGVLRVPQRLGGVLHPRLCIWNIDGQIQTQAPQLWEDSEPARARTERIKYSVVVPSTRYSRRLQALILGVAHQADYDLGRIEVIVSYVPGLDSNDDILDSMEATFPDLRIVRCTFTERHARSRGVMVNEAVRMASGDWVILFDSDIVVPTDFFARLDAVPEDTQFIAPDGRKMLTPQDTSAILLGERRPWDEFQEFLDGPGELWHREADGVPVGFCQIVRREILQELPYAMTDHFEGSDWDFSQRVLEKYGKEHRLEGCYVLHLDHGGSQWYGVRKQK